MSGNWPAVGFDVGDMEFMYIVGAFLQDSQHLTPVWWLGWITSREMRFLTMTWDFYVRGRKDTVAENVVRLVVPSLLLRRESYRVRKDGIRKLKLRATWNLHVALLMPRTWKISTEVISC